MNYLIIITIIISVYVVYKIIHKYLHLLSNRVKNPNFISKAKNGTVPEIVESSHFPEPANINEYSLTFWFWITDSNYTSTDKNPWKHILHKGDSFANKCQPAVWLNTKTNQLIIFYDLVERAYSYSDFKKNQYYHSPFEDRIDNKTLGAMKKKCNSMSDCKGISLACEDITDPCSKCHHGLFKTDLKEDLQRSQTYIDKNISGGLAELQKNYKDIGTLQKNMKLPSMNPNINPKIINHPYLIKVINNIPIGRWIHIGITCNPSSSAIYIDGVLKDTVIFPCNIHMNHNNLYVNTLNNGFSGLITQIRYFSRAITQHKVHDIYTWGPEPYRLPDITKFNLTLNKWIFCDEPLFTIRGKSIFDIFGFNRQKKESSSDFIKWYQVGDKIYRYNITHFTYTESKNYHREYNPEMMNSVSEMQYDALDLNKIYKDIEFSEDSRSSLIRQIKDKIPAGYKDMSFTKFDKRKLLLMFEDLNNGLIFGTYESDSTDGIDKCGTKKLPIPTRLKFKCPRGKILDKDGIECGWPPCPVGMNQNSDTGNCYWNPCSSDQTRKDGKCEWNPCPSGQTRKDGKCEWNPCPSDQTRKDEKCEWNPCPTGQTRKDGKCEWNSCPSDQTRKDGKCEWNSCPDEQTRKDGKCEWNPCPIGQTRKEGKCKNPPMKSKFNLDFENNDYLFTYGSTFFDKSRPSHLRQPYWYYNLEFKKGSKIPKHHNTSPDLKIVDKNELTQRIIAKKGIDFRRNSIAYRLFEKNKTEPYFDLAFDKPKHHFECLHCRDDRIQISNVYDLIDELYEGIS